MDWHVLKPDGFAIGLFCAGLIMFFLPVLDGASLIAILSSGLYWLVMVIVKSMHIWRQRNPQL